jgi:hypothetical protein
MPNKLPEYLASGAAVLAVGPREANGIDYVRSQSLACCITDRDPKKLADALRLLSTDAVYRNELAAKAQAWAFEHLDLARLSERFQAILRETAAQPAKRVPVIGPYSRDQRAAIDEAEVTTRLLGPLDGGGVLLHIGAHHGSSLSRFAEAGWTVVACEPDSLNRARTTVAELVDTYSLSKIDFLKIDVEGLDWTVLEGVPWDRLRPEVIECRFEDAKTLPLGYTHRELADDLVARGYTVYLSEWHPAGRYRAPQWRQLVRYPTPLSSSDAGGSILALRGDPGSSTVSTAFEACLEVENPLAVKGDSHEPAVAAGEGAPAGRAGEDGDRADPVITSDLSRYERLHLWASTRNPAIFFAGRLMNWCARKVRRYPVLTAAYLALLASLVVVGFIFDPPLASLLWVTAGALAGIGVVGLATGFAGFLIKDARHELEMQQLGLRRRLDSAETTQRADQKANDSLKAQMDGVQAQMDALRSEREAATKALEAKVAELLSAQEQARAAPLTEIGGLRSEQDVTARLAAEVDSLKSETAAISERALSFDIVSALRQLHPLWGGRNGVDRSGIAEGTEHGHAVLMALLVEEERKTPGALTGKTLIEVGSTRERDPRQGSTEKLAIFTGMMDMRFITVDVDPINTERALHVIELLNPGAKAITERGEDYLARFTEPLDYVYLDAFDFDHGQHSAERQARYREVLQTEIHDEACWQMHQLCAAAVITKMREGGIVVIDDTWTDDGGDFDGKGKLAVPLLLASGFTVIAQAPRTIALKRPAR